MYRSASVATLSRAFAHIRHSVAQRRIYIYSFTALKIPSHCCFKTMKAEVHISTWKFLHNPFLQMPLASLNLHFSNYQRKVIFTLSENVIIYFA
jgi:hypothetical protein